jgi:hypothetical protein
VCYTQKIAIANVEGTNIVFETAFLRVFGIVYPHDAVQGRCLLVDEVFLIDRSFFWNIEV